MTSHEAIHQRCFHIYSSTPQHLLSDSGVSFFEGVVSHGIETSKNVRWRVVADQVDSFSPDHSPHVHVVTHIDGTANAIASRPHQLKIEMHTQTK